MSVRPFISHFTPSLMEPEILESVFVQREPLAAGLVEKIRDSVLTPAKHYSLLIGPRGIGKTHMTALLYHRVQAMSDLREKLRVAWLREEEWGVTSFLDLLLRVLRALDEEYPSEKIAARTESLFNFSQEEATTQAVQLLKSVVGERTLLLLMENLDDLFAGLGETGQKQFRAFLQDSRLCTIVATAPGLFNGISRQTSPFYGFFRVVHLESLDLDGVEQLLTNIARLKGDIELADFIGSVTGRARLRALHHLAGGNHRVYVIFSQFLDRQALDELVPPFMKMLDELTPYYQARMAWLSPQQRKIVEYLCDRRGAAPVKDIAQRGFMSQQTAGKQLQLLREMGYVVSTEVGRESYYELREPLMRLCIEVKKNRGKPIQLFVDFLRFWYSPNELQSLLATLTPSAPIEKEYLELALRQAEEEEDPRVKACMQDIKLHLAKNDWKNALKAAEDWVAIQNSVYSQVALAGVHLKTGKPETALQLTNGLTSQQEIADTVAVVRGMAFKELRLYEEALPCLEEAARLNPQEKIWKFYIAQTLFGLNRFEEGIAALDKVMGQEHSLKQLWLQTKEEPPGILTWKMVELILQGIDMELATSYARLLRLYFQRLKQNGLLTANFLFAYGLLASSPILSAQRWFEDWQNTFAEIEEAQFILRPMESLLRYRETGDQRILLDLPTEERKLLESMLKMASESSEAGED